MPRVPGSPCAKGADNEEEVPEDSHDDGDDIESDPAPFVLLVDNVSYAGTSSLTDGLEDRGVSIVSVNVLGCHYVTQVITVEVRHRGGRALVEVVHVAHLVLGVSASL